MNCDPDADEQRANKCFEPVEHQHRARGPFAEEPARRWNSVEPESGNERAHALKIEIGKVKGEHVRAGAARVDGNAAR